VLSGKEERIVVRLYGLEVSNPNDQMKTMVLPRPDPAPDVASL